MTTHIFPFIKKIKLIFQSPPELIYIPKSFLYILLILLQTPFHWIELILYKQKIKSHKIKHPPVIILGYWRSGTTYLQRMLTVNKKTTYLSLYESILKVIFIGLAALTLPHMLLVDVVYRRRFK